MQPNPSRARGMFYRDKVVVVAYELGRSRSMERYGRTEGGLNNVQAQYVLRALIVETANARSWIPWV